MLATIIRPGERLVYSTRWFDDSVDRSDRIAIEIVVANQAREERLEALSKRVSLSSFLKREAHLRPSL